MTASITERRGILPGAEQTAGRLINSLCAILATTGGALLAGLAVMTVISVTGRSLTSVGLRPITGDFELVEVGCAVAIFSFLPWCQLKRGHVTVDLFVGFGPAWLMRLSTLTGDIIMTLVAVILGWRLWLGMHEMLSNGQETYLLGLPIWYGYVGGMIGASLFILTCLYTVWRAWNDIVSGQTADLRLQ
ncbi:MAG: TRAP transporter small permease [Pseudomonadota bacterium]